MHCLWAVEKKIPRFGRRRCAGGGRFPTSKGLFLLNEKSTAGEEVQVKKKMEKALEVYGGGKTHFQESSPTFTN